MSRLRARGPVCVALTFWDRALERLSEGERLVSICTGQDGLPSLTAWWRRCMAEPEFQDRAYAAMRAGDLIPEADDLPEPRATKWNYKHSPEAFEAVLEAIRGGRPYYHGATEPGVPSHHAIDRRRKADPDYDRRMKAALVERGGWITRKLKPVSQPVSTEPPAVEAFCAKLRESPPRRPQPTIRLAPVVSHELRRKLLQNEFYAAVNAAVPRWLQHDVLEDVRSEMVVDLLSGALELGEVKAAAADYVTDYGRRHDAWRDLSLDAPLGRDTKRTYGELIDAGAEHF